MNIDILTSNGGLNVRDSLDAMPERDAIQQDNIISDVDADTIRQGHTLVGNDTASALISFNEQGNEAIITADDGKLYQLNSDKTRTEKANGFASEDWVQTSFTDAAGGVSVFIANGSSDTPQRIYDNAGTLTIGDAGFTFGGLTNLDSPLGFKNRMYLVERGTFKIHYGGVDAITGALTEFDAAAIFQDGGSIMTIANWTQDAGEGIDNLFAIITTEGEVAIYQGLSPADPNWALRGVFRISKPVTKRCATKWGADLVIITQQGFLPLSKVWNQDRANIVVVSDKINKVVEGKDFTANWSIHWYSKKGWILINAPSTGTGYDYEQYVYNTKTGAWCRFVGMDALNWLAHGDNIYFCNSTAVYQADIGNTDAGAQITYYQQKAYSRMNTQLEKQILMLKERTNTKGQLDIGVRIGVDFKLEDASVVTTSVSGTQAFWDVALWDVAFWTSERVITQTKSPMFSNQGDFISIGILGQSVNPLKFYSLKATVRLGNGEIY